MLLHKIEREVNRLAETLRLTTGSDYEKEIKIHDWICQNIVYDEEGSDLSKPGRVIATHSIIGVFGYHRAQCEGIAKAVKVLLNAVNVKCIVVTGTVIRPGKQMLHAWNLVKIQGQAYHLDVTWDMGAVDSQHRSSYDYFNVPDSWISKDHKANVSIPSCLSLEYNYFTVNQRKSENARKGE